MDPLDLITPAGIDDDGSIVCIGVFSYAPSNSGLGKLLIPFSVMHFNLLYDA